MSGVRQAQKAATRARVLAAARDLFDEVGYDEATVRAIAARAGVSTGGVFAAFSSKADILSQVMADRVDGLLEELERLAPHLRGSTADRLRSIFAIHYAFEMRRPRLFLAHVAAAYHLGLEPGVTPYGRNRRLQQMLREIMAGGVERGELRKDADLDTALQLLLAAYAWNYSRVVTSGADSQVLTDAMDAQIGVIVHGLA